MMHRCNCTTKILEGFLKDIAGISIRQRPAQRLSFQQRTFGSRPSARQLASATSASPDDAFVPFDLELNRGSARQELRSPSIATSKGQTLATKTSSRGRRSLEGEDESAEWHAEIEISSPMVQAEQIHDHEKLDTIVEKSSNATDSPERSRAETRMLRKLKRVKDGVHNQSRPGKFQDQAESILNMMEGPRGAEILKSLVGTKDTGNEAAAATKDRRAKNGRAKRARHSIVKSRVPKGKAMEMRGRKKAGRPSVVAAEEADVEGDTNTIEAKKSSGERKPREPRAVSSEPNVAAEEQGTRAKKSRRERMLELKANGSTTKAADAGKAARTLRTKRAETNSMSLKDLKFRETTTSEELDEAPRPKQEPWGVQKSALERKFGENGWQPRKRLSPDTLEGIRALHVSNPTVYNVDMLREHFQISPEAIRRVLKSKWKPTTEEIVKRMKRWEKRGVRKWSEMAAQGQKPPKKWRELGVPNPKLGQRVAWEGKSGEESDVKKPLRDKAPSMPRRHRRSQSYSTPSLASRIL